MLILNASYKNFTLIFILAFTSSNFRERTIVLPLIKKTFGDLRAKMLAD